MLLTFSGGQQIQSQSTKTQVSRRNTSQCAGQRVRGRAVKGSLSEQRSYYQGEGATPRTSGEEQGGGNSRLFLSGRRN